MEIYSFFLSLFRSLPACLPHHLIRLTTACSFLSVSEPFSILRRESFISLECYCLSCMLENLSGNKSRTLLFSNFFLPARSAAYLSDKSLPAAYLFSPHSIKKCNNNPSSLLEYCILVSSHPPNSSYPLCSPLLCYLRKEPCDS